MDVAIVEDLKASFGIVCGEISVVTGGWLNRKWRVSCGDSEFLVKSFSNERYRRSSIERIDLALRRQVVLQNGVKCPRILTCSGGSVVRFLDDGTSYMVMEFYSGHHVTPATVTEKQMRSLGDACGKIHSEFAKLPTESVEGFPIDGGARIDLLRDNFRVRMNGDISNSAYKDALISLEPILNELTVCFFDALPKGIAHEDFSPDNMLFDDDGVTAILDFDRSCYSFLHHDIGRAVLSFALDLERGRIDADKVSAFVDGYSAHLPLRMADIADALKITWCIETIWWIRPEFFEQNTAKVMRFKDEILWVTDNWHALDSLLLN